MERLVILAAHCPPGEKKGDFSNLHNRGRHIFGRDEKDTNSASAFLIVLLDCIERWANLYKKDPKTKRASKFSMCYQELVNDGICFPSEAKKRRGATPEIDKKEETK